MRILPPPPRRKQRNWKKTASKKLSSSRRNSSGSLLKQGRFATAATTTAALTASNKVFGYEHVYYEASLELKGDNKYATYVKQIGLLFENIQLVNPTAIMHASVKSETAKPLGSKSEMSNNVTFFLGYAPVGGNSSIFKPKKKVNKKKDRHGKDKPDMIDPNVYPTLIFSSDVDPDTITSRVTHEFRQAGRFYFRKKQLQCTETCTPFIIYYLYTFNNLATIRSELTSLLMQNDFIVPEEFEHHKLPEINICWGIPKLPRQSDQQFQKYTWDMQEARWAHLIECDTSKIPFIHALINYIKVKEHKLTAPIWGGHAHITETVDWDSPKGDLNRFVRMSQDHTCYNMSVASVEVRGIANIDKRANIYCPTSGDTVKAGG